MQSKPEMRRTRRFLGLSLLLGTAIALAGGAGAPAQEAKTFPGTGLVRAVDRAGGMVTIRHEEIPGLRRGGTSVFSVRSAAALEATKPGDRVSFTTTEGLVLVEIGPQAAQAQAPAQPPAAEPGRSELGTIVGEVKTESRSSGYQAQVRIVELKREVISAVDGTFRFSDVPPGTYTIRAEGNIAGRFMTGEQRAVVPPGGAARVTIVVR